MNKMKEIIEHNLENLIKLKMIIGYKLNQTDSWHYDLLIIHQINQMKFYINLTDINEMSLLDKYLLKETLKGYMSDNYIKFLSIF